MSIADRAAAYLAKIPPPAEGQRNSALNSTAYAVLERFDLARGDYEQILADWIAKSSPQLSGREVVQTLDSAWQAAHAKGIVGSRGRVSGVSSNLKSETQPLKPAMLRPRHYDVEHAPDLPEPIEDGARALLLAAFKAGEHVRIAPATFNDEGKEVPHGAGVTLAREEWLAKLGRVNGSPNGLWTHRSGPQPGIFIGINPMRAGGTKDADVVAFRHVLVEFDQGLSPEQQWAVYLQANLPATAIIFSGGKSVHAWVRVEARDRHEFADRAALIYQHLQAAGLPVDPANRNPGRLSRLPNCRRLTSAQELLTLNTGAASFAAWLAEAQSEGIGRLISIDRLLGFKPAEDQNNLIGQRWICRGGSALLVGPSGVGKSSLVLQMAVSWAVGLPVWGIAPARPLRTLLMQAEDDEGDLAEMLQGITAALELNAQQLDQVRERVVIIRDTVHMGQQFAAAIGVLIERHRPDLVIFNPLLSFIGDDISRQEVCSQFLRGWLNPIAESTGVAWLAVHHTGKPVADPKSKAHWHSSDWAYAGLGSSELTNWARAIMVLRQTGHGIFHLLLTKRGQRSGAMHPGGTPSGVLWLKHASARIHWEQIQPDEEPATAATPSTYSNSNSDSDVQRSRKEGGRPSKLDALLSRKLEAFFESIPLEGESARKMGERLAKYSSAERCSISPELARKEALDRLVSDGRLSFNVESARYGKSQIKGG